MSGQMRDEQRGDQNEADDFHCGSRDAGFFMQRMIVPSPAMRTPEKRSTSGKWLQDIASHGGAVPGSLEPRQTERSLGDSRII
jgi:hypothetical protein